MKRFFVSSILCATFIIIFSIVTSAQSQGNKQYVEVILKSGEKVHFEFRPFIEANIPILPEKKNDSPNEVKWFGGRRLIFVGKDNCEKYNIGLENLRELEVIGIDINPCNNKKEWLFKMNLLALDKYIGFLQIKGANSAKALTEHGVTGKLLDRSETLTLQYEDIQKITFFPM